jgi:hypothetical protein
MKTLKQFLEEAKITKVKLINRDLGNDVEEIGAEVINKHIPSAHPHPEEKIHKLPLANIYRHEPAEKTHPDTASDESKKKIKGIVSSIKKKKAIEPILVRRQEAGRYEVVDGHHRVEAHLRAGLRHIPARVIGAYHFNHPREIHDYYGPGYFNHAGRY